VAELGQHYALSQRVSHGRGTRESRATESTIIPTAPNWCPRRWRPGRAPQAWRPGRRPPRGHRARSEGRWVPADRRAGAQPVKTRWAFTGERLIFTSWRRVTAPFPPTGPRAAVRANPVTPSPFVAGSRLYPALGASAALMLWSRQGQADRRCGWESRLAAARGAPGGGSRDESVRWRPRARNETRV